MFSCKDFRLLDDDLQAQVLRMDGVFLMGRKTERANIELFSLYNFYVEVFYEGDEPLCTKAFDDVVNLDAYLKYVHIDCIYETIKETNNPYERAIPTKRPGSYYFNYTGNSFCNVPYPDYDQIHLKSRYGC